jgi:hypothetical protein
MIACTIEPRTPYSGEMPAPQTSGPTKVKINDKLHQERGQHITTPPPPSSSASLHGGSASESSLYLTNFVAACCTDKFGRAGCIEAIYLKLGLMEPDAVLFKTLF